MKKADDIELKFLDADALRDEARNKLNAAEDAETPDAADVERLTAEYRAADVARAAVRTEYRESIEAKVETGAPVVEDAETRERIALRRESDNRRVHPGPHAGADAGGRARRVRVGVRCVGRHPIDNFREGSPGARSSIGRMRRPSPRRPGPAPRSPRSSRLCSVSRSPRCSGSTCRRSDRAPISEATISTALTADAKAKGVAQESTAAVLTPATATPRRISGRLTLNIEDVAAIGQANFESAMCATA